MFRLVDTYNQCCTGIEAKTKDDVLVPSRALLLVVQKQSTSCKNDTLQQAKVRVLRKIEQAKSKPLYK
jgi:hypothetical protein